MFSLMSERSFSADVRGQISLMLAIHILQCLHFSLLFRLSRHSSLIFISAWLKVREILCRCPLRRFKLSASLRLWLSRLFKFDVATPWSRIRLIQIVFIITIRFSQCPYLFLQFGLLTIFHLLTADCRTFDFFIILQIYSKQLEIVKFVENILFAIVIRINLAFSRVEIDFIERADFILCDNSFLADR